MKAIVFLPFSLLSPSSLLKLHVSQDNQVVAPGEQNVRGACPKDKLEQVFFKHFFNPFFCKRHLVY